MSSRGVVAVIVAMSYSFENANHNTGGTLTSYGATAARLSESGISRQQRSPADPSPFRVSRAASPVQGPEDSGHRRVFRVGPRRQPRAGRARAQDAEGA